MNIRFIKTMGKDFAEFEDQLSRKNIRFEVTISRNIKMRNIRSWNIRLLSRKEKNK